MEIKTQFLQKQNESKRAKMHIYADQPRYAIKAKNMLNLQQYVLVKYKWHKMDFA